MMSAAEHVLRELLKSAEKYDGSLRDNNVEPNGSDYARLLEIIYHAEAKYAYFLQENKND